jgi:hypothetical protein
MSNKETILKKAIEKAVRNGWLAQFKSNKHFIHSTCNECGSSQFNDEFIRIPYDFIYDKQFAKAFFGTESKDNDRGGFFEAWEYYLQEMVISPNPLEYLAGFLEEEEG